MSSEGNFPKVRDIEVEQKFSLPASSDVMLVEEKLSSLGFVRSGPEKRIVDWYFDLPAPNWVLTLKDCWLRYRAVTADDGVDTFGDWQLKIGQPESTNRGGNATVYEEIAGKEAINRALLLLRDNEALSNGGEIDQRETGTALQHKEIYEPPLPNGCGLSPFARIETRRSTWIAAQRDSAMTSSDSNFIGLIVDLDGTNFGYMVGEVEVVVHQEKDVADARKRIEALVSQISKVHEDGNSISHSAAPAIGKLEYYLMKNNPEHYNACVEAGSIRVKL